MNALLAVALVASQVTYYEARVTTFGCNSIEEVHALQEIRADRQAFRMALVKKQFEGQCVAIAKGTLVEGSIESDDNSILRVNDRTDPPGYEAPLSDFEIKAKRHDPS